MIASSIEGSDEQRAECVIGPACRLSVIVPARNEERNLPECLRSLVAQSENGFSLGREWELIVVDDASSDRTRELARAVATQHEGVRVLSAPMLDADLGSCILTGKNNACWSGAQQANGEWLLFTDADTLHEPGSLVRALEESKRQQVGLLSYSPRQRVTGFWQRALMPLIFSELASVYPTKLVNDPESTLAAANGQFLMVQRQTYFSVGGHRELGGAVLEDVELAGRVKRAGMGVWFRYAPDALSTRMYFGFSDMVEGWTKNLALLFGHPLALAAWRLLDLALLLLPVLFIPLYALLWWQKLVILLIWVRTLLRYYRRVARSNFRAGDCVLSAFALPLFVWLLIWSWTRHRLVHRVSWKGREYPV
ncbi:MAG: glycosyltransferase [Acidobacteriaceae bacterium]